MNKIVRVLLIVCLIVVNLYIPSFNVSAKTLGDLKRELNQYEADYNANKEQQQMSAKEKSNIQARITSIQQNIIKIGNDIIALNEEIEALNASILEMEDEIKAIMSFVQISSGESAYLEYAFGAKDFTDFIYRVAVSEQLTTYNNDLVEKYKNDIEANKRKNEELANKKVTLTNEQNSLQVELVKIKNTINELDELSLDIEEEIKLRKSAIKVYEDKGCKNNDDIATCGLNILPADTTFWRPMAYGELTGYFGPNSCYVDSYGNNVCRVHNGLDMSGGAANYNDVPAYSAANGLVVGITDIYDSNGNIVYKCGGKRVYVEHNVNGTIYTTAYLHLRRLNVKLGQTVTKDTVIGIIGGNPKTEWWDTCSTGAHLHFEISYGRLGKDFESRRVNPLMIVNFPKNLYVPFKDRVTKY